MSRLSPGDHLPGSGAPRFRILRPLGAGGMGVVYEALDLERDVRVALKMLRIADAQSLYRFKLEFRSLAEIVHLRLVPLFELIADSEQWFFTMELIDDSVDLLSWLAGSREHRALNSTYAPVRPRSDEERAGAATEIAVSQVGPLSTTPSAPPPTAANFAGSDADDYRPLREAFRQLAEGVHVLHQHGKLHRDLKPENVAVRPTNGDVVLLDFGLVAALETAPRGPAETRPSRPPTYAGLADASTHASGVRAYHATQAGVVSGTVAYMAPEQALALPLTAASDWYAVGVMLYEALTGRLPFQGGVGEIFHAKQSSEPPSIMDLVPQAPPDLVELCAALLRRDPALRPAGEHVVARLGGRVSELPSAPHADALFVGRSHQLQTLWTAFDAAEHGTVVAHVRGQSGAGKTALLAQFIAELNERPDTLAVSGRCYEQEFIPFKAVDSLMDALTRQLLQWSPNELVEITPTDASLLARLFPVVGRVFSGDPAVAESADLHAARQRAFAAMRELLCTLGQRRRLVLFIDDLQWGDLDSSALIADVLRTPDAPRLLLVLAYRSEQSEANASLRAMSEAARSACGQEREFSTEVGSLAAPDARALAEELLGRHGSTSTRDWMLQQSAGSAFLLHELAEHVRTGASLGAAEGLGLDDILWARAARLEPEARALLHVVAVAGRPIRLVDAQAAAGITSAPPRVLSALRAGRLVRTDGVGAASSIETFHDRVRESVLAHTSPSDACQHAGALACVLAAANSGDTETLAALFERAGDANRASAHYAAAVPMAVAALAFDRAEVLAHKAIELAKSDALTADAYEAAIHFYTDMARFADAYETTRLGARALGIELPSKFDPPRFAVDLIATQLRLVRTKPADLLQLPTMAEGRMRLAVRVANAGAKAAFQLRPELCVAVCTKIVRLCLTHGNTPESAIGYMVFGAIFQGGILGRYQLGHELGQLALALVDKYRSERQRAEVSFVVGYFGMSWLRPAIEAEALWQQAFASGQQTGDLFHMGCAAAGRVMSLHMRGASLSHLEGEVETLLPVLTRCGLPETPQLLAALRQVARDLRGATRTPGSWSDADYDEARETAGWHTFGARHFAHYCFLARAQSHYLWGRLTAATAALRQADRLAPQSKGMLHAAEHVYMAALIEAARAASGSVAERLRARLRVQRATTKLRAWARRCPDNFESKAELLHAESLRLAGRDADALRACARAAASAQRFGHVQVDALAQLLAARLQRAHERDASLTRARAAFERWGATALADATPSLLRDM